MDMVAHDFPGEGIRNQAQIGRALMGRQIGNICHPELLRGIWYDLSRACFQQVGVAAKVVMAVGGPMISTFAGNQLSMCPQEIK
ncbi:hypothetical protein SAMN04487962_10846 [Marinobacter segnicrescens]|uniref:Uncharacterized protein n=1 Tax=Marinobacter segnicrescens TaxID=430453 RepID=A0A1I0DWV4_9GAMM|nr:hypothetical protein SAMN04487962_10846 [Marinobacter segnicrescens]